MSSSVLKALKSQARWSRANSARAVKQGWDIFSIGVGVSDRDIVQIQRIDEMDAFETDRDAVDFIKSNALNGDTLSIKALVYVKNSNPEEAALFNIAQFLTALYESEILRGKIAHKAGVESFNGL